MKPPFTESDEERIVSTAWDRIELSRENCLRKRDQGNLVDFFAPELRPTV